jgi:ATP-dependent DNA helicase RecG
MDSQGTFVEALLSQSKSVIRLKTFASYEREEVMKTICAYLNGQGGWLVIGIDRDKILSSVDTQSIVIDIQQCAVSGINPLPLVYVHEEVYRGGQVVLVTVMKGGLPPYSYQSKYYIERKDTVITPDADDISLLLRQSSTTDSTWEKSICLGAEWEDLDAKLMADVVSDGLKSGRLQNKYNTPEWLLGHLNLTDAPYIKNGAMALFVDMDNAVRFLPQNRVRIQVMLGGKTAAKYEDSTTLVGNMLGLLNDVHDYFAHRLPIVSEFYQNEWDRNDYCIYPSEVIDEAVTNALIHRDMSETAEEVLIFIYVDRIEIINVGEMPANMVKRKNIVMPHVSSLRNPLMAEVFHIAGKMEKTGRGLKLIHDQMESLGRKLPEWVSKDGHTTLTIYRSPKAKKENARVTNFIKTLQKGKRFSRQDYLAFWENDISVATAKNDISYMLSNGLCKKDGSGPSTIYIAL